MLSPTPTPKQLESHGSLIKERKFRPHLHRRTLFISQRFHMPGLYITGNIEHCVMCGRTIAFLSLHCIL